MAAASGALRFVSVMLCSGPRAGKVCDVLETDLVHRAKKLKLGTHVLVKQHGGDKRRKAVVVATNAAFRVPPARTPTQPPMRKRPTDQPHGVISGDAVRPSHPISLPGPELPRVCEPALVCYDSCGNAFVSLLPPLPKAAPVTYPPQRPRVRRQLTFAPKPSLQSIKAPLNLGELDGIVPLDMLSNIVTVDEFAAMLSQVNEVTPLASPDSSSQASMLPAPGDRPVSPASFSRKLLDAESRFDRELFEVRNQQATLQGDATTLLDCMDELIDTIRSFRHEFGGNSDIQSSRVQ